MYRLFVILTMLALALTGCGRTPASPSGASAPVVLASTTFLADMVRNIAGDRLQVASLLPAGADPHTYQATPSDAALIAESKLLILNGIEYEHFMESLLENAAGDRHIITASDGLEPHEMEGYAREEHGDEAEAAEGHAQEAGDPHMWLDPKNVITYVENIREGLTHFDPDGTAEFQTNAYAYAGKLNELDAWIVKEVDQIPAEKRLLVTNHEALGYFAERYGFTVVGTVVESFSSDASPSAQQMADLIDQIKATGAPAIFLDASDNPTLAEQIAVETGVTVVTDLHLESLTDGPPAATYLDMMKHNVTRIVNALK